MSGLELATRCICEVVPEAGIGARVIMEAGYILLGAMCVALPQDIMTVSYHLLTMILSPIAAGFTNAYGWLLIIVKQTVLLLECAIQ